MITLLRKLKIRSLCFEHFPLLTLKTIAIKTPLVTTLTSKFTNLSGKVKPLRDEPLQAA